MPEAELEKLIFEILYKQAQVILDVDNIADVSLLDVQLAKQVEYSEQIARCMERKRKLYEQLLLQKISTDEYKTQKAITDGELSRLRQLQSVVSAQTAQMQMDEKAKNARMELAQEISRTDGLTEGLANTLIERVYVYPGNEVEIVWKMKDFYTKS